MEIPPLPTPSLPLTAETLTAVVRAWQVGQVLNATVSATPDLGQATLRIGTHEVPVHTTIPLATGETIRVRVASTDPTVTLKLMATEASAQEPPQIEALRAVLPHQLPLPALLANVALVSRLVTEQTMPLPLPPAVAELVDEVFRKLPQARDGATGDGLKRAVRDSGTFAEARLAQSGARGSPVPEADLKLNLVRLLATLAAEVRAQPGTQGAARPLPESAAPVPPPLPTQAPVAQSRMSPSLTQMALDDTPPLRPLEELLTQTQGVLARLQVSQLSSLPPNHNATHQLWLVELPLSFAGQADVVQLRFERRNPGRGEPQEAHWSVRLAFDLDELGAVHAHVSLFQGRINTTLWAERERTALHFRDHLDLLRRRMQDGGLAVGELTCHAGRPAPLDRPGAETGLVRERV